MPGMSHSMCHLNTFLLKSIASKQASPRKVSLYESISSKPGDDGNALNSWLKLNASLQRKQASRLSHVFHFKSLQAYLALFLLLIFRLFKSFSNANSPSFKPIVIKLIISTAGDTDSVVWWKTFQFRVLSNSKLGIDWLDYNLHILI